MKNVLILTYNFPPDGGPAVQRVVKFIKYIYRVGYRSIVVTSKHKVEITDKTLLQDIPTETIIYKTLDYGDYCPGEFRNKILKKLFVPDKQRFWGFTALTKVKEIVKEHKIDVIFSTSPPHSVHLTAMKIKNETKIPWIADFRDEWTKNPSFKDFINKEKNKELEGSVVKNTDHIVVCTKTAEKNFKNLYYIKNISVIMNGYDSEDFESITNYETRITNDNGCLNILYYGRLNNLHSINSLLKAMSELKTDKLINYRPIKLQIIGNNKKNDWLKNYRNIDEDVKFETYKTHKECLEIASSSDILLLLATNMLETEFFPAKVFEYIKTGRPILAILGKKGELSSFLESYGNSQIVLENDTKDLKKKLIELIKMKKNDTLILSDNYKFISNFNRKNQAEKLAGIFDSLVNNQGNIHE